MTRYDVAIVGAGIAGAGLAAELAPHARVAILEAEARPGYHATGRSAAFWSETYGGAFVQPLTTASGPALADNGYLEAMGSLHIARTDEAGAAEAFVAEYEGAGLELRLVDPRTLLPGLRDEWTQGVLEPGVSYIDVGALHAGFLKTAGRAGAELHLSAALLDAERTDGGWRLATAAGPVEAGILVNAAGAWADHVAAIAGVRPIGLRVYRRTMLQILTDPAPPPAMPHVGHIGGSFYWKPEAGRRIWLSPHDEIPTGPCDAQPEDIDVAVTIDRFEHVVDWRVAKLEHKWAGLRSFAPDRLPVYGFDPEEPRFFWCAGQGGFGIQTAPAASQLAAALLRGTAPSGAVGHIDPGRYAPMRFRD